MARLARFTNNATSRLAAGISAIGTTLTLTPGDGAKFPTLTTGQYFTGTLVKADGTKEIVKVTARASDTLTISRAYEAVAGVQTAYAFSAGDKFELRMTARAIGDEFDALQTAAVMRAITKTANYNLLPEDANTLVRVDTTAGAVAIGLPLISSIGDGYECIVAKVTNDVNPVSVGAAGSDTINGAASYGLTESYQSVWLIADKATNTWLAVNSGAGAASVMVAVDAFTGSGTAGPFTLSGEPSDKNNTSVFVGGVYQNKSTYTLAADQITLGGVVGVGVPVEVVWNQPLAGGSTTADLVSYILPFTGAVSRTLTQKISEIPSVADFGAVGDGVTDDTADIQKALDACLNLDFGDQTKTYKISGTLTVRDGAYLRGSGARLVQTVLQTPLFNAVSKTDVTFMGLRMGGVAMSTATGGAFVVGRKYSIVSAGTTDFTLIGAANNTPGTFFTATGAGSGTGVASTFYNTPNSQDIGIKADRATNLKVAFCTFDDFAYSPLMVALWGTNIKFLHNVVDGPGYSVLNPLGVPDPQVPGFRNCTGATILAYGVEVHGNTISNTSQGLIIGQQSRDVVVTNNTVLNTIVEHGMYCDTGCQHVRIVGNVFSNCRLNGAKVQWYDSTLVATSLIAGGAYVIQSVGTTDFTLIGAASNTVGLAFTATGPGTGTGVATLPTPADVTIVGNTFENCQGDSLIVLNASTVALANITGVTQANPGVITTSTPHGLSVNDAVYITLVLGMTPINTIALVNTVPTGSTFTLKVNGIPLDTSAYPAYTSGGTVARPVWGRAFALTGNTVRNCGQDAIGARFVDGLVIANNVVDTSGRFGVYQLAVRNSDVNNNLIKNTQRNGVYCYSPIDLCSVCDNTLTNVGASGDDTVGNSSGIVCEGDGGVDIGNNTITGEDTQTKMQYGIYITAGDKRRFAVFGNTTKWAQDGGARFHANDNYSLRLLDGNTFVSALGEDTINGLPTTTPGRGLPVPHYYGSAAPGSGTWQQGKVIEFQFPAAGSFMGVVSVAAGTPGSWRHYGRILGSTDTNPAYWMDLLQARGPSQLPLPGSGAITASNFYYQNAGAISAGGPWFIRSENANNNTKTDTAAWFFQLPEHYVGGTNLTVIVTARTQVGSGSPNITARTVQAVAYKAAGDGSMGAAISAVAQTITGSFAEYTFTLSGATLASNDIIWLSVIGVITETGGSGTGVLDVASVRMKVA